ncbi:hypothetical protein MTO96_016896 [Rhipicephalus appendiculatus]
MNHALAILCFGLACVVGGVSSAALYKDIAGCTTPEAEKCGYDFVPYFITPKLADDAKGLAAQCTLFRRQLKCGEDFAVKCLDGLPKGVILLMLRAAVDEYGMFCNTTSPKHKEYLDSIKPPDRQQIPYSCCYYHDFVECAEAALTRGCKLPAAKKFFEDIIDHVFGEVLSLACNKYKKGTGACEALPVLPTKDDAKARDRGFIEPLAVIASKLG